MKSLQQYLNENLILELSSDLLTRASKKAREQGRGVQANKFAIAAGKALEKELKKYKPGPDGNNGNKIVDVIKDMSQSNSAVKALAKADPAGKTTTINFPVLKDINNVDECEFVKWRKITIPKAKFYVYKDEYAKKLHIGTLSDILCQIGSLYFDFEDFDASNIVKGFEHAKDAVEYAYKVGPNKFIDSKDFLERVKEGFWDDSDLYWEGPGNTIIEYLLNWANVKNLPTDWQSTEEEAYK